MQFTSLLTLFFSAVALAAPARIGVHKIAVEKIGVDKVDRRSPGRVVPERATCTIVQGRKVCDDGLGNTFFADDPFSS